MTSHQESVERNVQIVFGMRIRSRCIHAKKKKKNKAREFNCK